MTCRLRRLAETDLERVRGWRMQPDVARYMYTEPSITPQQQRAWFERVDRSPSEIYWIIELIDGDQPVGLISLNDIDHVHRRCSWAYYLGEDAGRGRGLGRLLEPNIYDHVFRTMEFHRLWCEVLAFNKGVIRLHERFGSRVEGTLRDHVIKNGENHDVVRMGILEPEWRALRETLTYQPIEIEQAGR